MNMDSAAIQEKIQDYCSRIFPERENLQVQKLRDLNNGWESIIYRFELLSSTYSNRQHEQLILRIYPGEDAFEKSRREFEGMRQLLASGYPVPRVYALAQTDSPFDRPFMLMENITGEILWPVLDRSSRERAVGLLSQFCELFVQLHHLDWRPFTPAADQLDDAPYEWVERYFALIQNATRVFPDLRVFHPVMAWLEARKETVPCVRPAPIHWDFHPGNVILRPDGSMTVIDWTQIQVSDPRFDLGWTLLLAGAYMGDEIRNLIFSEYQRIAGMEIEQMTFFDVANALKRLGTVMISLLAGADRMGMRPDAVENMRRDFPALQWVYDRMVARTHIRVPSVEDLLAAN